MRVVLQRVLEAGVEIAGESVATIDRGLLLLTGFSHEDTAAVLEPMAKKISRLRVFSDTDDRLQYDITQAQGAILVIPQFTLLAGLQKGRRPDFTAAMAPDKAKALFNQFVTVLRMCSAVPVSNGVFGANMQVSLINNGPFTLTLDSCRPC